MNDLIIREAVIDAIWDGVNYDIYTREVKEIIEALPAVDPVKRGRWEKDSDAAFYWRCSECGCYLFWRKEDYLLRHEDEPNFCPNCGASMMDGGEE